MSASTAPPVSWPRPEPEAPAPPPSAWPLLDRLVRGWRLVLGVTAVSAFLGLLLALILPKQYTSTASFVPEERAAPKLSGGLAGLIGQVGLLSFGGSESPEFYQRLLNSRQLRTAVLTTPYDDQTLIAYYKVQGRRDSLEKALKRFGKDYSVSVDRMTKIVRLDVELRRPALAQAVAGRLLEAVDSFNSTIRRSMAGERREFVERRFAEAGEQLDAAERALRDFNARNRSIVGSPDLQFERNRLERRIQLANNLYENLARDLQTARIDEVNDTPVISIIDPPSLPVRSSSPRKVVFTLLGGFLGGMLAIGWTLWATRRPRPHG